MLYFIILNLSIVILLGLPIVALFILIKSLDKFFRAMKNNTLKKVDVPKLIISIVVIVIIVFFYGLIYYWLSQPMGNM